MTNIPDPITRAEQYYAYMAGKSTYLPEPITREEKYLYYLCINGSGGGGTPGPAGVGIQKIEKTGTEGLVDTYTITYTNGQTSTYTVTNGATGEKGDTGDTGPQGETGAQGPKGDTGATPNIQIGTVQTLDPGQQATASMTGTPENPLLNLGIPKGEKEIREKARRPNPMNSQLCLLLSLAAVRL